MQSDPILVELDSAWGEFIEGLRVGDGASESVFHRLSRSLEECAGAWRDRSEIPRLAVNILIDIFIATEGSSFSYPEQERTRIQEMAFRLQDLVRECVGIPEAEIERMLGR